jgi:hypothetical protein
MARTPLFCIVLAVSLLIAADAPGQPNGRRSLRGHVPAAAARSAALGRLDAARRLRLAVGLPLRDPAALDELLGQLYDPGSPQYRRFLTPDEFTARFGPTEQQYQTLIDFARTNGLTIAGTAGNRAILDVSGSVADIERVFGVTLRLYRHPSEARNFFAPDREPTVDAGLPILDISGLDDFVIPHPMNLKATPLSQVVSGATPYAGSMGGYYIGNDFRAAYAPGVALTGTGQSVGLFELDGYDASDIASYESLAGLTNSPLPTLQNLLVDSVSGNPGYSGMPGAVTEVTLDIEMTMAMAPGLSKVIVYEGNSPDDVLNCMATNNQARQLSSSWGFSVDATTETLFQRFAAQGQSFFQASGDSGAWSSGATPPSDSTNLTIVGGTDLSTSSTNGPWSGETTWSGSSGGVSTIYSIPAWQQGVSMASNQGSTVKRNAPDVAMVADQIFIVTGGSQQVASGTSVSTPLWAAFTALVNQQAAAAGRPAVGFVNPAIYSIGKGPGYAADFHDITTGNNFNAGSPSRFSAVAGYDLCTGWGTPNGINLIVNLATPDFLGVLPGAGFSASGAPGGPFTPSSLAFTLTNSGAASLTWSMSNLPPWLVASPASGTLAAGAGTGVTVSLNAYASTLAPGQYSATVAAVDVATGVAQFRTFSLAVTAPQTVQNGGFETGDFSNWTLVGSDYPDNFVFPANNWVIPHSGTNVAMLGQQGLPLGTLSQTLTTVPGQVYLLSFWLDSPDGLTPNAFQASWNGSTLLNLANLPTLGWTNPVFLVSAAGTSSILQFGFRNDNSYLGLDDVSVVPVTPPVFLVALSPGNAVGFTWNAMSGLAYQVQYTTNLSQPDWINLGGPIQATNGFLNASDTIGSGPHRFYRLFLLP